MRVVAPSAGRARRFVLAAVLVLCWFATGLFAAVPAAAHAELIETSPPAAARLDVAPTRIELRFTESIALVPSALRLVDAAGTSRALGQAQVQGSTVRVDVPAALPDGSYVFVYRVISGDSHPIAGGLAFSVGAGEIPLDAAALDVVVGSGGEWDVAITAGAVRALSYLGVILLIGVPAFTAFVWRAGGADVRVRALTLLGAGAVSGTALLAIPMQAVRAGGTGWSAAVDADAVAAIFGSGYGLAATLRLVGAIALLGALLRGRRHPGTPATVLAVGGAAVTLVGFSRSGHPAVSDVPALTMGIDALHLGAMAVWIGGLLVLALRVLPTQPVHDAQILSRWSPVAMAAVAVLVLTGSAQAWREIGSIPALVETTYGRWILVKVVGLAALLALGEFGRRCVRATAMKPGPTLSSSLGAARADQADAGALRRSVFAELAIAAAVLIATAFLVVTTPGGGAADAAAHGESGHGRGHGNDSTSALPASGSVELPNSVRVEVSADPRTAGSPTLTIITRSLSGQALIPAELRVTAAHPQTGIAPITLAVVESEPGRYTVEQAPLLVAGTWQITVTVRTTDVDAGVGTVSITLT